MRASGGGRLAWHQVPAGVRAQVDAALGSPVVRAVNQPGGFSPGLAARCLLGDGRRVFVKAVSPEQNPQSTRIQRREADVASRLPPWVPAPRVLHRLDDGQWVVLVFEDVDGRQPAEPWTTADLDVVLPAVRAFGDAATPAPVDGLQPVADKHRAIFGGWRRLAVGDGDLGPLPRWCRDRIDDLAAAEAGWESAAAGDTLLHADLRADNVLLRDDGTVVFVDWPWACRGAAFVDPLLMLPSIGLGGGPDPGWVIDRYDLLAGVDERAFLDVFTALCGFLARASQDDAPVGLPALRTFQRAQADVGLSWLRDALPG